MKYLLSVIILIVYSNNLLPQCKSELSCNSEKPFYTYTFPGTSHKLILCGSMDKMTKESIYASEFFIINVFKKDTVIFFNALQNCRIDKKDNQALNIIETKILPFGKDNSWIDCDYIKYSFTEDRNSKVIVNKSLILKVPAVDNNFKKLIYGKYEQVIKDKLKLPEEISYEFLLLALNGDRKARDILFNMKDKLKLDGAAAEENSEAIEIYSKYSSNIK